MGNWYCLQMLCPKRHCLLSSIYAADEGNLEAALAGMEALMPRRRAYCMLCGSREFHYETRRTQQQDQVELAVDMAAEQQEQAANRERLKKLGIPLEQWPKDLRFNFDHFLDQDAPVIIPR